MFLISSSSRCRQSSSFRVVVFQATTLEKYSRACVVWLPALPLPCVCRFNTIHSTTTPPNNAFCVWKCFHKFFAKQDPPFLLLFARRCCCWVVAPHSRRIYKYIYISSIYTHNIALRSFIAYSLLCCVDSSRVS